MVNEPSVFEALKFYFIIYCIYLGADIENIVNQAALKAAKDGQEFVGMEQLDFARDKVLMGKHPYAYIENTVNRFFGI